MNKINKRSITSIGYDFMPKEYIPKGKDEYYLRNIRSNKSIEYRSLTAAEIEILVRNNNTSDNWNNILVSALFNPQLVKNCSFFGLVRMGKLETLSLEFHNLNLPVGLYNSTIISCDFGDNVCVHNVNYFSHFVVDNEVMIANVNELATTNAAKFGNGIIKQGEMESQRIWLEICNENGGRKILPFDGMLPADAFLWSKYRDDSSLMKTFQQFTEKKIDHSRGYYGYIGERTVIKNCKMIKDVLIGTDAYIKGANKIKNVTINSNSEASTQIGEGSELVNGIIGVGCRVFYGVKAVRFFMASHSQLKYGARLINSYLGNNSTISCCEVLNSLIYPFHEQHHNNSFLCASLLMGQTNMAAGATIGSNHNSRGADGELIAGRGFWPGLCVSLKHNSRFASFTLLAKGDFPFELNIPLPFSLIINDYAANELRIIPAYWFQYNYYALQRNEWKYRDRDARSKRELNLEYDSLAPDSINEIFEALDLLCLFVGKAYDKGSSKKSLTDQEYRILGKKLLENDSKAVDALEILAEGFENSKRKVVLLKVTKSYQAYKEMINYYAMGKIIDRFVKSPDKYLMVKNLLSIKKAKRQNWTNLGGQLVSDVSLNKMLGQIRKGGINSWDSLHHTYQELADKYEDDVFKHALASLWEINQFPGKNVLKEQWMGLFETHFLMNEKVCKGIVNTRKKDLSNPFRKSVYSNEIEQEAVLGKLADNSFIKMKSKEHKELGITIGKISAILKTS